MANRLAAATSPYLLQHKDNPVDWWPWSDEAFAEARRRGVPVLLSVGYAACHWCHVMARVKATVIERPGQQATTPLTCENVQIAAVSESVVLLRRSTLGDALSSATRARNCVRT